MRFTKANVSKLSLPPGKADFVHFDSALPGFGLRIRATGKRTWFIHKRTKEGVLKRTIGDISLFDLDEARMEARKILNKVEKLSLLDEHERQQKEDERRRQEEERMREGVTLARVADLYVAEHVEKKQKARTQLETKRHLRSHWAPLRAMPLHKVSRRHVAAHLSEIASNNGPIAANRARSTLNHVFIWAMQQGLVEDNPVIGTSKPGKEIPRDRVLKHGELRAIWQTTNTASDYNSIIRLLLLTGQRRDEVAGMRWSEIDYDQALWTLPRERTKNGLQHDVPLSNQALEIILSHSRRNEAQGRPRDLIFGRGSGPFSGWSRCKMRLDAQLGRAAQSGHIVEGENVESWRLHDLRRSVVTGMAEELGVLPHVIEGVVNHVSGHKSGVAGIYNRATYAKEKRTALQSWADHVNRIVAGDPARPNAR
ncbi:MAG: tyrosine-type recombinase/integrase [Geminicoccaceae bacterium]